MLMLCKWLFFFGNNAFSGKFSRGPIFMKFIHNIPANGGSKTLVRVSEIRPGTCLKKRLNISIFQGIANNATG